MTMAGMRMQEESKPCSPRNEWLFGSASFQMKLLSVGRLHVTLQFGSVTCHPVNLSPLSTSPPFFTNASLSTVPHHGSRSLAKLRSAATKIISSVDELTRMKLSRFRLEK